MRRGLAGGAGAGAGSRGAIQTAALALLLCGPLVLSFFSGGYFDQARAWAGLVTWLLALVAILVSPRPLPRSRSGRVALAGLAALAAWTLLSILWAPVPGDAYHRGQIVVLYAGGVLAAAALMRAPRALRAVEPAVAAGTLVVVGYGLSERLLPGVLHFQHSASANGRLEQPLTYWNTMGELAAIGVVICLRLASDPARRRATRLAATAAAAPLGLGLYVSFSRGALFAAASGVVTVIVLAPDRAAWRSAGAALLAAVLAGAAEAPFGGITSLRGSLGTRESQGAVGLALLGAVIAVTVALQTWLTRRERNEPLGLPRWAPAAATVLIAAGLAVAIVAGAKESTNRSLSGGAGRLVTLQSNRYAYWRVAMRAFGDEPLRGVGAGGWAVYWLRYRPVREFAADAHSLPLQTLAELGIVGLALLLTFFGATAAAARRAYLTAPGAAVGPIAGAVAYLVHAPLDWDWEMPVVTLFALALVGALLALADGALRADSDPVETLHSRPAGERNPFDPPEIPLTGDRR